MCHGLVMSLSEPSVLKDKRGRATICCAGGSPGLPSLPSRLSPLSPTCLQSGPPHHAALFIPVLGAMSPILCDMATTSVLLAVAQPLTASPGVPGLMDSPALGGPGKKGRCSSALFKHSGMDKSHNSGPWGEQPRQSCFPHVSDIYLLGTEHSLHRIIQVLKAGSIVHFRYLRVSIPVPRGHFRDAP